jgi:nucleotide-binding universal stress UspA family protein
MVQATPGAFTRILVATDASSAAAGAQKLADLVAERDGTPVAVLSVLDPEARVASAGALVDQVERRFASLRGQIGIVVGARPQWHAAIDIGPVGETICRVAGARRSDLIIVGFGLHRRLRDRTPEKATVRRIAELSSTPVLVVPSQTRSLPTRVMLALDFSRSSIRAGRAAIRLMGSGGGVVHLVYVHTSYEPFPAAPVDPDPTYTAGFAAFFDAVERELSAPPCVSFERAVVQRGDPVSELLAYGSTNGMELIAVGNHGKATHERLHLGSVSAGILRSAQCAVLVSGTGARVDGAAVAMADTQAPNTPLRGGQ